MAILIFFIVHWYLSAFSQTFFLHRYAAHGMFTMSKGWERFFFIFTFITQGASYFSPYGYGVLHKMHHAYADTDKDPHSPIFSKNFVDMMRGTYVRFNDIIHRNLITDTRFTKNVPKWKWFDSVADHLATRATWGIVYFIIYYSLVTVWWQWILFPATLFMSPIHGAIINWFAHKFGDSPFEMTNTSTNLFKIDLFTMGEGYHNNHHRFDSNPNFGVKWYELDMAYPIILALDKMRVIKLKAIVPSAQH